MKDPYHSKLKSVNESANSAEMNSFFDQIKTLLADDHQIDMQENSSFDVKALNGECIYIIDYIEKKLLFKTGFKSLLGFEDEEVDFDFVFKGYHHEDAIMIREIIKSVVASAVNPFIDDPDLQLSMTYRRKRKDGSYIHLLSQSSVYELGENGKLLKSLTRLSDISYLDLSTPVSWSLRSKNLEEEEVSRSINALFENPFTKREIEVIKEIQKGGSNKEIADALFISPHTVATHRKNIFRKCNCNSILDLMVYCKRLEIL